jgi:hypothetical protein
MFVAVVALPALNPLIAVQAGLLPLLVNTKPLVPIDKNAVVLTPL